MEEASPSTETVQRPDEPLEMPTRITGARRGHIDYSELGGDEVAPIADGHPAEGDAPSDLTRVRREQRPPSIFDDSRPGTDPEQHMERNTDE